MLLLGFLLLILGVAVLSLMPENGYAPRPGEGALHHIIMRR
ncbi:MAG TPA: hypothetical protein VMF29_02815 [Candidatus Edwardsbacteria bacterium]|nr:hypothetical protein [Candidatus Edwardsbacteria bacterium]